MMNMRQFQNRVSQTFYRPKRKRIITGGLKSKMDELDQELDQRVAKITGRRTRKDAKDDDKDKE